MIIADVKKVGRRGPGIDEVDETQNGLLLGKRVRNLFCRGNVKVSDQPMR